VASAPGTRLPAAFLESCERLVRRAVESGTGAGVAWSSDAPTVIVAALPGTSARTGATMVLVWRRSTPFDRAASGTAGALAAILDRLSSLDGTPPVGMDIPLPMLEFRGRAAPVAGPVWIGRDPECAIVLDVATASRRHALVIPPGGAGSAEPSLLVLDFASAEGLAINGRTVARGELRHGDVLQICGCEVRCTMPPGALSAGACVRLGMARHAGSLAALGRELAAVPATWADAASRGAAAAAAAADPSPLDAVAASTGRLVGALRTVILRDSPAREGVAKADLFAAESAGPEGARTAGEPLFFGRLRPVSGLLALDPVRRVVDEAGRSGRPRVGDVEPEEVYRQHDRSISFSGPLPERSLLCVPVPGRGPGRPLLLFTSARPPTTSFRQAGLAVACAVAEALAALACGQAGRPARP
jgi:hypothetical protein